MKWQWIRKIRDLQSRERHLEELKSKGGVSTALVYPNIYHLGMSNLGFQSIYTILNRIPGVTCERAFLPDPPFNAYFQENRNLRTMETQRPLQDFDVIGFSLSYELDFPNIIKILEMSGIPLLSSERQNHHPLVIAGGAITYLNPEPIAPFIDCFALGEGEIALPSLFSVAGKSGTMSRESVLLELSKIPGIYVPALYSPIYDEKGILKEMITVHKEILPPSRVIARNARNFYHSQILTGETEFKDTLLTEIMRGCAHKCSFCAVGNCFGPLRLRDLDEFTSMIEKLPSFIKRIGLIGAAVNCHPRIREIVRKLLDKKIFTTFSSMRVDGMNEEIFTMMKMQGNKTITLAPECGNESMRWKLKKFISDEEIYGAAQSAGRYGIKNLRLYFMVGLPEEKEEDINSIIALILNVRELLSGKEKAAVRISASINQFIPKAGTPLENVSLENPESVGEKMKRIRADLPGDIRLSFESPRWASLQCILAQGDRRISDILMGASQLSGSFRDWEKRLESWHIDTNLFLREKNMKKIRPWSHLEEMKVEA